MNEKEIHLRDYLRIVQKRRYTVMTFFIITFTVVLIGTMTSTSLYNASTKLLIEKSEANPLVNYSYVNYDPEFLETQSQIIKSTSVARKVVKLLNIGKTYDTFFENEQESVSLIRGIIGWFKDLFSVMLKIAGIKKSDAADETGKEKTDHQSKIDAIAGMISSGISVTPVRNSKVVNISFMSQNPELAGMVVNTVAKAYIEELLEMKMEASGYTLKWMTQKAGEEGTKLEKSEKALQEYMKAKDIVTIENRIAIIPQKLSELSRQLTIAEAKRKEMEAVYRKVAKVKGHLEEAETLAIIASDAGLQAIREQILKTEQHIMELSKKYGRKHPVMIRGKGDLAIIKEKREHEIRRIIKSVKNEYELAKSNEEDLRNMLAKTKNDAASLNEKFIQYGILKRNVETNQGIYNALTTKLKEQSVTEQMQTVNVWIVEEARTPKFPSAPNKKKNLLFGIIMGLFGGIGLAFFIEYLDNTIKSPEDVEERFGVPVLGMVPLFKSKDKDIEEVVKDEPASAFSESYKAVRTAVLLSSAEAPPRRILITSMSPQDGKTTTAINLAITIAQSEKKVLLIDGDLRKPRLHNVFRIENSKGLSTFLAGASDKKIIQKGSLENLSVITSGPVPPNPSELLSSDKFEELVKVLSENFDFIIFDSPPIMTVTDSLILSKVADGTLIVTKGGKTTYDMVNNGLKSLTDIKSNILGVVINAVDMKKSSYYYYNYQNYYYSSDDDD